MIRIKHFLTKKQDFIGVSSLKHADMRQSGAAIVWILMMVTLFAALGYVMSQGTRGGASNITDKQAELAATEILNYARKVKEAVHALQIDGCSDTEISFENSNVAGYINPNAPTDNSCHVFHVNGGGIQFARLKNDWLDSSKSSSTHYGKWFVSPNIWIVGLGVDGSGSHCLGGPSDPSCRELTIGIPYLDINVCKAINKQIKWGKDKSGTPIQDGGGNFGSSLHTKFVGDYSLGGHEMGTARPAADSFFNITTGCIEGETDPLSGTYHFFQVLIAR